MTTAFIKSNRPTVSQMMRSPLVKDSRVTPAVGAAYLFPYVPADIYDHMKLYEVSVWAYASVYAIAMSAAGVELKFCTGTSRSNTKEFEDDFAFRNVIKNPNPFMSEFDLWEHTYSFLELSGNSYWELVADPRTNQLQEIYPLRPDRMKITGDPQKLINKYTYEINGKEIDFAPSDILHFKYFNPLSDLYGMSPLKPASETALIDLYSMRYNKNFFKLGARVGGVLETEQHLSNEAIQRLEDTWNLQYSGYEVAWRTAILQQGLKYKELSSTHKDMDFVELRKQTREEIFGTMGVYPIMFGLVEYANYASAFSQKKLFYENTIIPKLKKVDSAITQRAKQYKSDVLAVYDIDAIEALKEEKEVRAKIDAQYTDSGIKTINEIRAEHRMTPVSWGDQWWPRAGARTPLGLSTHVERTPSQEGHPIRIMHSDAKHKNRID